MKLIENKVIEEGNSDNYDLANSHVLPALLRRIISAKRDRLPTVTIWGSGTPRREFLHVDDMADASVFLMNHYNEGGLVNVGCGTDVSILELAQLIAGVVGYDGTIETDPSKPDGTPRKLMDVNKLHALGWQHRIQLPNGIAQVYAELRGVDWQ